MKMTDEAKRKELTDSFFPVMLQELHCDVLRAGKTERKVVPRYKAVVDTERGEILSVVTDGYRLVTNREAFDAGRQAFAAVFGEVIRDFDEEMEVFKVDLSKRRTTSHVDLLHSSFNFNVWQQENWKPYLRVTNSYNKRFALHFDLGFVRSACSNGMIFSKATLSYKRPHTRKEIDAHLEFPMTPGWLTQMVAEFGEYMTDLRRIKVDRALAQPLMAKALDLRFDDLDAVETRSRKRAEERRRWFKSVAPDLVEKYGTELREMTAYTVFNAATDFASRPPHDGPINASTHGLQVAVGRWVDSFPRETRTPGFSMDGYVGRLKNDLSLASASRI